MESKNKSIAFNHIPNYDATYYPKTEYISGKGAFEEGCFPSEVMTEEEIVSHFFRKSAVRCFLNKTNHNLQTLAESLEIPVEKLLTFDCLRPEEVDKLDMLRVICEEEFGLYYIEQVVC